MFPPPPRTFSGMNGNIHDDSETGDYPAHAERIAPPSFGTLPRPPIPGVPHSNPLYSTGPLSTRIPPPPSFPQPTTTTSFGGVGAPLPPPPAFPRPSGIPQPGFLSAGLPLPPLSSVPRTMSGIGSAAATPTALSPTQPAVSSLSDPSAVIQVSQPMTGMPYAPQRLSSGSPNALRTAVAASAPHHEDYQQQEYGAVHYQQQTIYQGYEQHMMHVNDNANDVDQNVAEEFGGGGVDGYHDGFTTTGGWPQTSHQKQQEYHQEQYMMQGDDVAQYEHNFGYEQAYDDSNKFAQPQHGGQENPADDATGMYNTNYGQENSAYYNYNGLDHSAGGGGHSAEEYAQQQQQQHQVKKLPPPAASIESPIKARYARGADGYGAPKAPTSLAFPQHHKEEHDQGLGVGLPPPSSSFSRDQYNYRTQEDDPSQQQAAKRLVPPTQLLSAGFAGSSVASAPAGDIDAVEDSGGAAANEIVDQLQENTTESTQAMPPPPPMMMVPGSGFPTFAKPLTIGARKDTGSQPNSARSGGSGVGNRPPPPTFGAMPPHPMMTGMVGSTSSFMPPPQHHGDHHSTSLLQPPPTSTMQHQPGMFKPMMSEQQQSNSSSIMSDDTKSNRVDPGLSQQQQQPSEYGQQQRQQRRSKRKRRGLGSVCSLLFWLTSAVFISSMFNPNATVVFVTNAAHAGHGAIVGVAHLAQGRSLASVVRGLHPSTDEVASSIERVSHFQWIAVEKSLDCDETRPICRASKLTLHSARVGGVLFKNAFIALPQVVKDIGMPGVDTFKRRGQEFVEKLKILQTEQGRRDAVIELQVAVRGVRILGQDLLLWGNCVYQHLVQSGVHSLAHIVEPSTACWNEIMSKYLSVSSPTTTTSEATDDASSPSLSPPTPPSPAALLEFEEYVDEKRIEEEKLNVQMPESEHMNDQKTPSPSPTTPSTVPVEQRDGDRQIHTMPSDNVVDASIDDGLPPLDPEQETLKKDDFDDSDKDHNNAMSSEDEFEEEIIRNLQAQQQQQEREKEEVEEEVERVDGYNVTGPEEPSLDADGMEDNTRNSTLNATRVDNDDGVDSPPIHNISEPLDEQERPLAANDSPPIHNISEPLDEQERPLAANDSESVEPPPFDVDGDETGEKEEEQEQKQPDTPIKEDSLEENMKHDDHEKVEVDSPQQPINEWEEAQGTNSSLQLPTTSEKEVEEVEQQQQEEEDRVVQPPSPSPSLTAQIQEQHQEHEDDNKDGIAFEKMSENEDETEVAVSKTREEDVMTTTTVINDEDNKNKDDAFVVALQKHLNLGRFFTSKLTFLFEYASRMKPLLESIINSTNIVTALVAGAISIGAFFLGSARALSVQQRGTQPAAPSTPRRPVAVQALREDKDDEDGEPNNKEDTVYKTARSNRKKETASLKARQSAPARLVPPTFDDDDEQPAAVVGRGRTGSRGKGAGASASRSRSRAATSTRRKASTTSRKSKA